ncbi:MAG: hypothetical protein OHK0044_11730 [Burkholderiaceae bacterium]
MADMPLELGGSDRDRMTFEQGLAASAALRAGEPIDADPLLDVTMRADDAERVRIELRIHTMRLALGPPWARGSARIGAAA